MNWCPCSGAQAPGPALVVCWWDFCGQQNVTKALQVLKKCFAWLAFSVNGVQARKHDAEIHGALLIAFFYSRRCICDADIH